MATLPYTPTVYRSAITLNWLTLKIHRFWVPLVPPGQLWPHAAWLHRAQRLCCGVWHLNTGNKAFGCCRLWGEASVDRTDLSGASLEGQSDLGSLKAGSATFCSVPTGFHVREAVTYGVVLMPFFRGQHLLFSAMCAALYCFSMSSDQTGWLCSPRGIDQICDHDLHVYWYIIDHY